jgi:hypothetical protein
MSYELMTVLFGPLVLAFGLLLLERSSKRSKSVEDFKLRMLKIHLSGCLMASGAMMATIKGVDLAGALQSDSRFSVPLLIISGGIAAYTIALSSTGFIRRKDAGATFIGAHFPTVLGAAIPIAFYAIIV